MRFRVFALGLLLGIACLIGVILAQFGVPARAEPLGVTAGLVERAPAGLEDPLWKRAESSLVPVEGRQELAGKRELVAIRALYTNEDIFFLLQWPDPTRSTVKQAWTFDGANWLHLEGNEDRIALLFEITRIDKFASRGCAVTCHSPPDLPRTEWRFATRTPEEEGDLWHWKAARSDPYQYADDASLTVAGNPTGSYRTTGRRKDAGQGGDVLNETDDRSRPRFMPAPGKKSSAPGFLLMEEAIEIQDFSIFKPGDVIPYRLPVKPEGSRADVRALSRHEQGRWTVMLSRKLDTGHEDDVVFHPSRRYSFALAVFDDSGDDHSKATEPLILVFGR